jgi:hypothetical protein
MKVLKQLLLLLFAFCAGFAAHEIDDYLTVKRELVRQCERTQSADFCEDHWLEQ